MFSNEFKIVLCARELGVSRSIAQIRCGPETAQMVIIGPLTASRMCSLFSKRPQTGERIARLMDMPRA